MEVNFMKKNCGIIAEMSNEAIKRFIEGVSLRAFAEEVTPPNSDTKDQDNGGNPSNTGSSVINYEDLIAKARKEEKEKQYKTIEKLRNQVDTLTTQHNNDLLKVADLEGKLQTANDNLTKAGSGDSEEVKTLKETIKNLEADKGNLENKVKEFENNKPASREEIEASVRAELETEYEVKTYKATKMAELKEDILVPELVFGNTKEEIDASIQSALERSAEIKKNLGISDDKKQKRTPKTPANPSVSSVQDSEISLEKLATMDVRSPEYAKLRQQLGLK